VLVSVFALLNKQTDSRVFNRLEDYSTVMQDFNGIKIAILVLLFVLVLRLILKGWQKVALSRTGGKFRFLLTKSPFSTDVTWRDVRYSVLVVVDALICIVILIWLMDKVM
jgi:chromate transport protein ChrA